MGKVNAQIGNRYRSLEILLLAGTVDYSVCQEHPNVFPDWNDNWDERDWWTILVLKNFTNGFTLKFHNVNHIDIPIKADDAPAIFEHILFRDVFLSNVTAGEDVYVNLIFVSNRPINPPPRRPKELTSEALSPTSVRLSFKDTTERNESYDEDYFKIERSSISGSGGFSQIGTTSPQQLLYVRPLITMEFTDSTVVTGTQYWYRVRAYNSRGGNSPFSNTTTITP